MSRTKWKGPYVQKIEHSKKQEIFAHRSFDILPSFVGLTYLIHDGRNYKGCEISKDMVGHKFGEFVATRAKYVYKKKNKKKTKKIKLMGQKTNPNIFQLGKTKKWSSKFIEKKNADISKYFFKNLELNKFILKFFENYELQVCDCKIFYTENSLTIFVLYFVNFKTLAPLLRFSKKKIFKKKTKNVKVNKVSVKKIFYLKKKKNFYIFAKKTIKSKFLQLKTKNYTQKLNKVYAKTINTFKNTWLLKKTNIKTFDSVLKNNFLNKLFKNINLFFTEKPKIILNFNQINNFAVKSYTQNQINFIGKNLSKLRPFHNNSFLKEGLQVILLSLKLKNASYFLINYLAKELQKHKKQHFFLNFIQKTFEIFNKIKFGVSKHIKIQIKGRFNGASRSKTRILQIGKPISIISCKSKVYYTQTTSFSSNGTFGIKLWITEETKKINNKNNDTRPQKTQI